VVAYGTPSRTVKTAVKKARENGQKIGMIRPISVWPFPDELFQHKAKYLSVELDYDGQMVREVQRVAPADSEIHFFGKCGELPTVAELHETFDKLLNGEQLNRIGWEREAW
jgi:2-oxoglutarate ferredoxin oxidoreductase subunit alpha